MTYHSYEINDHTFAITFNGKPVFTAHWQRASTLQQAKDMVDGSLKLRATPDKQAALSKLTATVLTPLAGSCELENGREAAEQSERWSNNEADKQLNDYYEY